MTQLPKALTWRLPVGAAGAAKLASSMLYRLRNLDQALSAQADQQPERVTEGLRAARHERDVPQEEHPHTLVGACAVKVGRTVAFTERDTARAKRGTAYAASEARRLMTVWLSTSSIHLKNRFFGVRTSLPDEFSGTRPHSDHASGVERLVTVVVRRRLRADEEAPAPTRCATTVTQAMGPLLRFRLAATQAWRNGPGLVGDLLALEKLDNQGLRRIQTNDSRHDGRAPALSAVPQRRPATC